MHGKNWIRLLIAYLFFIVNRDSEKSRCLRAVCFWCSVFGYSNVERTFVVVPLTVHTFVSVSFPLKWKWHPNTWSLFRVKTLLVLVICNKGDVKHDGNYISIGERNRFTVICFLKYKKSHNTCGLCTVHGLRFCHLFFVHHLVKYLNRLRVNGMTCTFIFHANSIDQSFREQF